MDESDDSCYVLELCDLLEEYKELSEKRFHENTLLQQTIQHLKQDNISLLNKNEEQSRIIDDLQNNITSLVSDIDSMSLVLSSKDKDISNLSNCIYIIHEKKVNIDDTYSSEQEQTISTLLKEVNRIECINSSNEALLEDYMNIINQKDLEITELQALMRLSKLESNQSLSPSINPTVTVTDITADNGYLISPMISSNSSSSSTIISPSTGRLANTPPPPPPNKAPPLGLTLDYNKLKGKDNKSSDSVIDTTAAYHLEVDRRTRKQYGQKKVDSRQVVKQQSSSNQDDSSSSSSSSSPTNSCSNYERTTPHHDDDDDDHNAEPNSSADEDSQTEEEGSPIAVVINRDYSNRSNRSFINAAATAATSVRSSQHRMVTKALLGDNSSRIMKISKKEGRYIASSSVLGVPPHGEKQQGIFISTTNDSSSSKPVNANATSTSKWSDIRKHENLFTKVPIFKNSHRFNSRSYIYFSPDVTVEDIDPEEEEEERI